MFFASAAPQRPTCSYHANPAGSLTRNDVPAGWKDAGFEPGTAGFPVWCTTNEPPHPPGINSTLDQDSQGFFSNTLRVLLNLCDSLTADSRCHISFGVSRAAQNTIRCQSTNVRIALFYEFYTEFDFKKLSSLHNITYFLIKF